MSRSRRTKPFDNLTRREIDILQLLCEGLSNQEIADRLSLGLGTVKWYANQIYAKLGVHSRTKAVAQARRLGLISSKAMPDVRAWISNLPTQLTPFVGRTQELREITEFLRTPSCRLLTLVGAPGVGKTRLSLQAAAVLEADFPDGVYFVPLATIFDSDSVMYAVGATLGIAEGAQPILEDVRRHFQRKTSLLVLDNFEQVLDAAPLLTDLLSGAPRLKLLVTSREALRLYCEQQFLIPTLPLPDLSHNHSADVLRQNDAVALFVQRAGAVRRDYQLTEADAHIVAEVCIRLDGLPLAIELAAARVKLLTPAELLHLLAVRLSVLTEGSRDAPERQRTLRNTLDWSYSLLQPQEQAVFACLGIFTGGWTIDAAQAVCKTVISHSTDIINLLNSLLDKSLIVLTDAPGDETRFMMLETLREYALEKLPQSARLDAAREAHARYYLSLTEQAKDARYSNEQIRWFDRLTAEYRNMLAAVDYYHESADGAEAELSMMDSLGWFWHNIGDYRVGCQRVRAALARDSEALPLEARASGYSGAARMERAVGNYTRAAECYEKMLTYKQALGDERGMVRALVGLAITAHLLNDLQQARQINEEAIAICKRTGDFVRLGELYNNQANILVELGETGPVQMFEEALEVARRIQLIAGIVIILHNLGRLFLHSGEYVRASDCFEESSIHAARIGNRRMVGFDLMGLGETAFRQGNFVQAERYIDQGLAIADEMGHHDLRIDGLVLLAKMAAALDERDQAFVLAREALATEPIAPNYLQRNLTLELLAEVMAKQGQPALAARLFGALEPMRQRLRNVMHQSDLLNYEQIAVDLRRTLGEATFADAWREGKSMTTEEAIILVLRMPANGVAET